MEVIKAVWGIQPIVDIDSDGFGLNRDRMPDRDHGALSRANIAINDRVNEVPLDNKMKTTLLEDLAYIYGSDSKKFTAKLKEFNLKIH
jgi:hypothetical protein